ncbi:MAG: polymerase, sigma-24 subunit, subfamily [Rhodocyclales bacterium]|nr:polymerase, sigma-24 subunit, subfamily [Rhodocyclales bacterium]
MTDLTKSQRFEATVLPHLNSAFNLARWLTRSDHDAEDVVQEAYLKAFKYFERFHGGDGRTWLLAIVRNTFYTHYRQSQEHSRSEQFDEDCHSMEDISAHGAKTAENALQRRDDERMVNRALEKMPIEFREVLVMRELDDLSYRQIADVIGIPIGTVMSRLARGRKLFAGLLAHNGQEA